MQERPQITGDFFYVPSEELYIVFADDDPVLREFARVHLSSDTVQIETASDGLELITMLDRRIPDLILLDLEMPNMDGFEVLKYLGSTEALSRTPVIVVTGREDVAAIDRAYEAGATSFVVKPLNWRQLSYQIRYVRRTAQNEATLLEVQSAAVREGQRAVSALRAVASEGSQFLSTAVARDASLKEAGARFASVLFSAVDAPDTRGRRRLGGDQDIHA